MDKLDITPLQDSITRLDEGWKRYQQDISDEQIRDGLVQRFEFTYEICHKMLKRFLIMTTATPTEFDQMPFQDLIRTGNQQGLLRGDWTDWRLYREMRGKTSHTYNKTIALEVVSEIPAFLEESHFLLQALQQRLQ